MLLQFAPHYILRGNYIYSSSTMEVPAQPDMMRLCSPRLCGIYNNINIITSKLHSSKTHSADQLAAGFLMGLNLLICIHAVVHEVLEDAAVSLCLFYVALSL